MGVWHTEPVHPESQPHVSGARHVPCSQGEEHTASAQHDPAHPDWQEHMFAPVHIPPCWQPFAPQVPEQFGVRVGVTVGVRVGVCVTVGVAAKVGVEVGVGKPTIGTTKLSVGWSIRGLHNGNIGCTMPACAVMDKFQLGTVRGILTTKPNANIVTWPSSLPAVHGTHPTQPGGILPGHTPAFHSTSVDVRA